MATAPTAEATALGGRSRKNLVESKRTEMNGIDCLWGSNHPAMDDLVGS